MGDVQLLEDLQDVVLAVVTEELIVLVLLNYQMVYGPQLGLKGHLGDPYLTNPINSGFTSTFLHWIPIPFNKVSVVDDDGSVLQGVVDELAATTPQDISVGLTTRDFGPQGPGLLVVSGEEKPV